jgi:hypothetical protein
VPEHLDRLTESLVRDSSRRGFLARVGGALMAVAAARTVGAVIAPGESEAFHFCGHTFNTGSCPHPGGLPRIDSLGYPLRPVDGRPIDDAGRLVNDAGQPVDEAGELLRDPDGRPLPPAPRSLACDRVQRIYGIKTTVDGSWYRCCGGKVRKLVDCCSRHETRINGDDALKGYCYAGRKVFCVLYYDTTVPC